MLTRSTPQRRSVLRASNDDIGPRFAVGLDLGQVRDYTAAAVLERVPADPSGQEQTSADGSLPMYHLRHLERYPLGTTYPEIVDDIEALLAEPPLTGRTRLIVDGTGVGVPVVNLFQARGLRPVPIWITAGETTSCKGKIVRVPKRDLVAALQVLLQSHRLKIARNVPEREILVRELLAFRAKITTKANDTYEAWREGDHDDMVFALALAAWFFERTRTSRPPRLHVRVGEIRM